MTTSKSCANCIHFRPNEKSLTDVDGGICRAHPPMPMIIAPQTSLLGAAAGVGMAGVSPPVDATFLCGEHSPATRSHHVGPFEVISND